MSILQKKFFDLFPSSFGLDLSDLSIKALWLDRIGHRDCFLIEEGERLIAAGAAPEDIVFTTHGIAVRAG